jgi:hypothetical protein
MSPRHPDVLLHGTVGGLLAGAVVAFWFVVVDAAAGQAFHTPARLASIVLGEDFAGPWPRLVTVFTLLHFGVFISLSLVATGFLKLFDMEPGLLLGLIFGIGVFNAVHYGGLLVTGSNLLTAIPVAHVAGANVVGGMVMMAYLHRVRSVEAPFGWNVLKRYPLLYHGLTTGLVGAAAVALWFFLLDLATSRPFSTPAALGSAILLAAQGPGDVRLNAGVIVAYSFLHVTAFILVGVAFAWLASRARQVPGYWLRAAAVLLLVEGLFYGTVLPLAGWVLETLGVFAILGANLLAVVTMGVWIWRRRPSLQEGPPQAVGASVRS